MDSTWIAIRLYYGEKAFGISGNFSEDLKELCIRHKANYFHIENQGGYSTTGSLARSYLFGGSSNGVFNMAEIVTVEQEQETIMAEINRIAKAGKFSLAYSVTELNR